LLGEFIAFDGHGHFKVTNNGEINVFGYSRFSDGNLQVSADSGKVTFHKEIDADGIIYIFCSAKDAHITFPGANPRHETSFL